MSEDESSSEEEDDNEVLSDEEDPDNEELDPASIPIPRSSFFTEDDEDKPAEAEVSAAGAESRGAEGGAKEGDAGSDNRGAWQEEGEDSDDSKGIKAEPMHYVSTAVPGGAQPYLTRRADMAVPLDRPFLILYRLPYLV